MRKTGLWIRSGLYCLMGLLFILGGCRSSKRELSLAGEWRLRLDPDDLGVKEQWYNQPFTDKLLLPGSLQAQGFGNDVDINTKWTGQVVDNAWYTAPEYEKYRQPGNIKVPFWLNPEKHYVGVAWYQKEVRIPLGWNVKTTILELERTHWETTLYIDGEEIGKQDALSTPHRYALELQPGKHTFVVRVDNRVHIPVGINAHSVSDHTQSNWNGITGRLQLIAKPQFHIDDIQIFPDIDAKKVDVNVKFNAKRNPGMINLILQIETLTGEPVGDPVKYNFSPFDQVFFFSESGPNLPLVSDIIPIDKDLNFKATIQVNSPVLLWSEHTPNLYRLRTVLESMDGKDESITTFGFRQFKAEGTRFLVNGQPIFLRGTLECCIFPLTGYPSMDKDYWAKIYGACKDFGLNHVRFHSWCPPEVAFDVADSMGIYLQVECAAWATIGNGEILDKWLYAESDRILKEYGNHPSFCLMNYGNEPGGRNHTQFLSELVDYWQKKDNRRVYNGAAGWPYIEHADYWNTPNPRIQAWGSGLNSIINAQPPRSNYDFAAIISKDMPTVSHEIGQWCVYPNFNEIEKYTGVLKAKNFEIFKETLAENKMSDLAEKFLYASGRLQTLCYKADIEAALRTPGFAGFQLLDLHDFPGQGTALVGVLDPFWETKGYVDGKEYSMFCNQTVPLIRFPKMVWLNNETMSVPLEMAHFGEKPIANAAITWVITTSDGKPLKKGVFNKDLPLDNCIPVGNIDCDFSEIKEAQQLLVSVQIENTTVRNQWHIWVYPAEKQAIQNAPYIASQLDQAVIEKLNRGEKVLLTVPRGAISPKKGGDIPVGFSSIFWNTAWTRKQAPHTLGILCDPRHPAFASFPNEGFSDYQWWDIVSDCDAMLMDDFPADFRPIVHLIDDWFTNRKLGILLEVKVGNGKLMVCSADLKKDLDKRPAAAQFRQSILEYMASDRFNPEKEVGLGVVMGLF